MFSCVSYLLADFFFLLPTVNICSGIASAGKGVSKESARPRWLQHSLRKLVDKRSYYWLALGTVTTKNFSLPSHPLTLTESSYLATSWTEQPPLLFLNKVLKN